MSVPKRVRFFSNAGTVSDRVMERWESEEIHDPRLSRKVTYFMPRRVALIRGLPVVDASPTQGSQQMSECRCTSFLYDFDNWFKHAVMRSEMTLIEQRLDNWTAKNNQWLDKDIAISIVRDITSKAKAATQ